MRRSLVIAVGLTLGVVAVACSRPTLTRLLHTTGFDRIVPVTETVEEAATALATAGDSS